MKLEPPKKEEFSFYTPHMAFIQLDGLIYCFEHLG